MTDAPLTILEPKPHQVRRQMIRFAKYLLLGAIANTLILGSSRYYIKKTPPTYTSSLVFNVAGGSGGVNVNLPDIGQAATSVTSNFNSKSDPRENYKLLLMGNAVIQNAAKRLKITERELGKPRADLLSNTTTLRIEMTGASPQEAHDRVKALYQAFYDRLEVLRVDEQIERNKSTERALVTAQAKLGAAQKEVSSYKLQSGFNSSDQIKKLIDSIEALREKQSATTAQRSQVSDRLQQLTVTVEITPQKAAEALALQTDQQIRKSFDSYTTATTELGSLLKVRGPNYPDVVALRQKQDAALTDVLARGNTILGREVDQGELETLLLDYSGSFSSERTSLFKELVDTEAELTGLTGELGTLQTEIKQLERRLSGLTQKEAVLDQYLRELDIAEAVFAATLTKIDLGRGDLFASYPLIQVLEDADMPSEATGPKPKLVYAGAILGAIAVSMALTLGWYRDSLLKATQAIIRGVVK